MKNYQNLEDEIEKKFSKKDKRKKQKMKVSGSEVFELKKIMTKNQTKNTKKSR